MTEGVGNLTAGRRPAWPAMLELLKPVTWFPPMWAFLCGVVAAGAAPDGRWHIIAVGLVLAGPLICGTSQAVNDWFDRHVDAINEPRRPIPSGRLPGFWGLYISIGWTFISLVVAYLLGPWVFAASLLGMALAWMYSAPPFRLKKNGWWGNSAVALCYEGVPWLTAVVVMTGVLPNSRQVTIALLYSFGAHGIMTLNDFKSVAGDQRMGVGSLPVRLGVTRAVWVACIVMVLAQIGVIACLLTWQQNIYALMILALLIGQLLMMRRLVQRPAELDVWYNALGVPLYVLGMMVSALALRNLQVTGL